MGSSLSTDHDTLISSPSGFYAAGFHAVGQNAYTFTIWFTHPSDDKNYSRPTIVWMANREEPVNGKHSQLSLLESGNLVLRDAGQRTVWASEAQSISSVELKLLNTGNLVLRDSKGKVIWQSFDTPTDTLLPGQQLAKNSKLVSLRSSTNYSSGFYKLQFSSDNVLQLLYEGLEMASVYWPDPWNKPWDNGRSTYNNTKIAVLDTLGHFKSTDNFEFNTSDYGEGIKRRLILDIDGNIRVYSLNAKTSRWSVSWQLYWQPCRVHGICGLNSLCSYTHHSGRKSTCLQGHRMRNATDWSYGCEPDFKLPCPDNNRVDFLQVHHGEFFGFQKDIGNYACYAKTLLFNGHHSPPFEDSVYIKLLKDGNYSSDERPVGDLQCDKTREVLLERTYERKEQHGWLKSFIWFTVALGAFEIICLVSYLITTLKRANAASYVPVVNRFKRFTYVELKKVTSNFREEIGRGSGGVVYKGTLSNNRVAAIKCLGGSSSQGEAEFLAEVSTIGKLNHMNLIEIWGYCAEKNHRLLVYEYMEHGSTL